VTECALWYWSHGSVDFELFEDEQSAASFAHALYESNNGAPECVQFPDGRYIRVEDWPEFEAEEERIDQRAAERARKEAQRPRPAIRQIAVPWDAAHKVTVMADAPAWLGRR
jgi:hypothetical protein